MAGPNDTNQSTFAIDHIETIAFIYFRQIPKLPLIDPHPPGDPR
jgi:hypothetical protein